MKINRKLRLSKLKTSFRIVGVYSEGYNLVYRENHIMWKILVCFCIIAKWLKSCQHHHRYKIKIYWENYFIYKKEITI